MNGYPAFARMNKPTGNTRRRLSARVVWFLLGTALFAGQVQRASGMYMIQQLVDIPIGRLLTNFTARLATNPTNYELTYDLARLHSMAYALTERENVSVEPKAGRPQFAPPGTDTGVPRSSKPDQTPVEKAFGRRHLTNAILLYDRAIVLLKRSTNSNPQREWLILPLELGRAWCIDRAGDHAGAIAAYRRVLKLAWQKEVIGDFSFADWVRGAWDAVRAGKSPLKVGPPQRSLGDVVYSHETIVYLRRLLDPVRDAKELAELKEKEKTLAGMGRWVTPIVVPVAGKTELPDLVSSKTRVRFDLDGSGRQRHWGWPTRDAAWLVWDPKGEGQITSGLQLFGQVTFWIFWPNGYAALSSLDNDDDGALTGSELDGLALWLDANQDGVSNAGEVRPLREWNITRLGCRAERNSDGGWWCPAGVRFGDSDSQPTYDWLAPADPN